MGDAYLLINDMGYDGISIVGVFDSADARFDALVKMAAQPRLLPYPSEGLYGRDVAMNMNVEIMKEGSLMMSRERIIKLREQQSLD